MSLLLQPQGTVDHFISSLINTDADLAGGVNGTATGRSTYYSPVIHTTTIGPLQPGVTYYYRVSRLYILLLGAWAAGQLGGVLLHLSAHSIA